MSVTVRLFRRGGWEVDIQYLSTDGKRRRDRKVLKVGTIPELLKFDDPWVQEYFRGPRGRAAAATVAEGRS